MAEIQKVSDNDFKTLVFDLSGRTLDSFAAEQTKFRTFYGISALEPVFKNFTHRLFYFTNDDDYLFGAAAVDANEEKIFRNTLRKDFAAHLKFTKKLREYDQLNKVVNPDKITADAAATALALSKTFIGQKKARYKIFIDQIIDFGLGMIHRIYWESFKELKPGQYTLLECIEYVVPVIYKMEEAFSEVLDEEYDTSDLEKAAGVSGKKSDGVGEKKLPKPRKKMTKE